MEQSKPGPENPLPRLITVAGLAGSGKTAVVEALVIELTTRGRRVGTIKTMREHRGLSLDPQGTDTRRHAAAGASVVVALHADGTARFETGAPPASLRDVSRLFPPEIEILVSEGAIEPSQPGLLVLCLRAPSELEETLRTRRLSPGLVTAISGKAAREWQEPRIPAFDVMNLEDRRALADLLLGKIGA